MGDNKFLDGTGLQYLWSKIKQYFVPKSLGHKEYSDLRYSSTQIYNGNYRFWTLAYIKPTDYNLPCKVTFKIHTSASIQGVEADSEYTFYFRRRNNSTTNDYIYSGYECRYNQNDVPGVALRYFGIRGLTSLGIDNNISLPFGWYQGDEYGANSYTRTFIIDVIDTINCNVIFPDAPINGNALRTDGNNTDSNKPAYYTSWASFYIGTMANSHTGDANDFAYAVGHYYAYQKAGLKGANRYSIVMMDKDGKYQSIVNEANNVSNALNKTANQAQFQLNKPMFYMNSSSDFANNSIITAGVLRSLQLTVDMRYSLNIYNNATAKLTAYSKLYLVGTVDSEGYFKLDTTKWWSETEPISEDGKVYIYLGIVYPDTYPYRCSVELEYASNAYWYKNGMFRHYPETGVLFEGHQDISGKANKSELATVATSGNYNDLSNKPTIPTVNNATLTIQKNGTNVTTFTANASSNATANITVPTKVSDLTNDSGFTTNTGTITGIKMNGASKGTSGVVDLGTVITSHQSLDAYATKAAYNRKVLTDVSINAPESNFSTYLVATSAGLTALNNFANTVKTNKQSDKKYFNGTSIIDDRANSSITVELEYDSDNDKFLYLKVELDSTSEEHYFGYIPLEVATNKEVTILSSDTYAKATIKYTLTSAGVLTFSKYEMYSTPVYHPTLTFNYSNTDGTSVGTKDIELDNIQVNTVHADSADMAFKDGSGNSIENTYLNKYGDTMRGILSFSLGEGNKARIRQLYNNNILELQGGNQQGFGGFLQLFGKNYTNTNLAGSFRISASNGGDVTPVVGSSQSYLDGKPNGTLSWNDKAIIPVEESGTNYIRYTNGIQICWGRLDSIKSNVSNQTYGKAFNNTPAFTFTSSRNPNTYPLYASWTTSTFNISGTWNSNGHTIGWIAIGTWK